MTATAGGRSADRLSAGPPVPDRVAVTATADGRVADNLAATPLAPTAQPVTPPAEPKDALAKPAKRRPQPLSPARCAAISMLLLALVILGFVGYLFGVTGLQEASAQSKLYSTLSGELGQDLGPLGPYGPSGLTALGAPVAVLNIPSIGVKDEVVVQGTAPEQLTLGPGHLRSTPLPGQTGTSVIYGRRVTFGAPFAKLDLLKPGDEIITITQQGRSVYKVVAVGDSQHPVHNVALNQLALLTASSRTVPSYYLEVDANLVSTPQNGPVQLPVIGPTEKAMAGDDGALVMTMLWGMALALLSLGGAAAATRWSPWAVYLVLSPAVLAVLWNLYENLAALLPNLY